MTSPPTPPTTNDVEMNLSTSDNAQPHEPPARLAERFQRKTSSRRRSSRSSAHSSRRSSISSLHSRTSNLSCHGGPYSTHIAQHLRRASIIESRKARLAERAAHVEQVRLRAAAAKSVPRISNSEEKALAAQAAREKLLAEITARCEEEVRRAKRIAEETKEKKAAEHARLRDEMAEKFAHAARRRTSYQLNVRRPRTTSLAAVEEKKIDPGHLRKLGQNAAAKVIQRAWRKHYQRSVATSFASQGISLNKIRQIDFEDATKTISSENAMTVSIRLLKLFGLLDGVTDETAKRGAVRVFLSSYMLVAHPIQAFSHGGQQQQEKALLSKGEALVEQVEADLRLGSLGQLNLTQARDRLQFLFNDFTSAFHAWKSKDLDVLVDVMVGSFVNLDLILQSTKDDTVGHVAEDYLHAVRQEQTKILVRLKRLVGHEPALARIRSAVRRARRDRAANQPTAASGENVPRASTPTDMVLDVNPSGALTPPATPRHARRRSDQNPSSFITRLGHTMTVLPPNREIAHEMQISGIYEVQQQPWTDARKDLLDALRRGMRETMHTGGKQAEAAWTHSMVLLVKDKLMALVSQKHPLHDRIDGFLDAQIIEQQVRNSVFSYNSFFETLASLVGQICSPGRDEIVQTFKNDTSGETIDRLFSLINILDLMTLDHINFQFRLAARSVIEHGHEHEHSMFEKDLQDGLHTLRRTKRWWTNAKASVGPSAVGTSAHATSIYARGLTDLIFANTPLKHSDFPETLRLDYMRLLKLRARAFKTVTVASILLTSKIRLRRNREALWSKEAERLMKLDMTSTDVSRIVSMIESGHMMPESTRTGLVDFVSRVLPTAVAIENKLKTAEREKLEAIQSRRSFEPENGQAELESGDVFIEQIATFLLKSVREHVFARLAASSTSERVRVTTSASETLARVGMPEFVAEVGSMVEVLERVRTIDLKAHEQWYDQVAADVNSAALS